jgi:hypothetical protein
LAKGWNLIERFPEDIDIFLDPLLSVPLSAREVSTGSSRNFATPSAHTPR